MNKIQVIDATSDNVQVAEKEKLTAEELAFKNMVAKGYSLTKAYRMSHPAKKDLAYDTIRRYAHELYAKSHIKAEVEAAKETQAKLARLAEDRLEQILTEDDSAAKGSKVAEVAMFMYDHANGKATQRVESTSQSVNVNIDLSSA